MMMVATAWVTTREGLRFISRSLGRDEERVVLEALRAWDELTDEASYDTTSRLRTMVYAHRVRCIHGDSFARARERCTFGYTDERGRILLNPRLCFGSLVIRGRNEVYVHDLVVTLSTMVHEDEHFSRHASEQQAYRAEWRFLKAAVVVARAKELPYAEDLEHWESETGMRVSEKLGAEVATSMQAELDAKVSYRREGSR